MAFVDLPLEELEKYKPDTNGEKDFDIFWKEKDRVPQVSACGI